MQPISVLVLCQLSHWAERVVPELEREGCHRVTVAPVSESPGSGIDRRTFADYDLVLVQPTLLALNDEAFREWARAFPGRAIYEVRFAADGSMSFARPGLLHPGGLIALEQVLAQLREGGRRDELYPSMLAAI